jgi:hypothetical protein
LRHALPSASAGLLSLIPFQTSRQLGLSGPHRPQFMLHICDGSSQIGTGFADPASNMSSIIPSRRRAFQCWLAVPWLRQMVAKTQSS